MKYTIIALAALSGVAPGQSIGLLATNGNIDTRHPSGHHIADLSFGPGQTFRDMAYDVNNDVIYTLADDGQTINAWSGQDLSPLTSDPRDGAMLPVPDYVGLSLDQSTGTFIVLHNNGNVDARFGNSSFDDLSFGVGHGYTGIAYDHDNNVMILEKSDGLTVIDSSGAVVTPNVDYADGLNLSLYTGITCFSASPVPEPSSTALLGLGGLALILRRRK